MNRNILNKIAKEEGVDVDFLLAGLSTGEIVIPKNRNRRLRKPIGIGKGLRTKVNANIGTSPDSANLKVELRKLRVAEDAGADTIMDLSTGGDLDEIRRAILEEAKIPVGTVPIYQACVETVATKRSVVDMEIDHIFQVIEKHAQDGVDFITVHCGVTMEAVEKLKKQKRITEVVSRGGRFLIEWMLYNKSENPLYEYYDRLLEIAKEYGVTLSLGDGLRPGSLADASDRPQIQELIIIGELVDRAREAGVQAIVEGPGHVPMDQIESNVLMEKTLCKGAPFYVLGPLVTDISPGYDHISAAIGGAIAAQCGADFLCYVTPTEHLSLPDIEDVREGVIALRIAAHAADIAKGVKNAADWDRRLSKMRKKLDWNGMIKLSIDPERAKKVRERSPSKSRKACSMCGEYCVIKNLEELFRT